MVSIPDILGQLMKALIWNITLMWVNSFIRMVYRQIEIQRKMNIKMRVLLFLFVLPNCLSVVIFLNISSWREEIMLVQTRDTVIFW